MMSAVWDVDARLVITDKSLNGDLPYLTSTLSVPQMPKWSKLKSKILQLQVTTVIFSVLALTAVIQFFCSYGLYNYDHIPEESLSNEFYKATIPSLVKKQTPCAYDEILNNPRSIEPWELPTKYNDFSPLNIQNGSFTPTCAPAFSVAILVTYRNRQKQLDVFLPYMHNFLRKQNIHYKIYLIEQRDEKPWNKGMLYNIGARRAIADKFPCLVLHDVDLLPLDAANLYACTRRPRHMSASIDKFRHVLPYGWLCGGVLAIRADQYALVDGFSNRFEGWGGEDDDMYDRIVSRGLEVCRFPRRMSRYTMLRHAQAPRNVLRERVLRENWRVRDRDGYSHLPYINVEVTYTMLRHAQAPRNVLRERVLRENWRVRDRDRDGYSHLPYINVEVTYTMLRHAQAPRNVLRERVLRENWRVRDRDRDGYSHLPYINVEVTYTMLRHAQAPRNLLRERVLRENWRVRDRDGYSHLPYINVEVTYTMLRHAQAPRNVLRKRVLRENWRVRDRDGYSHLPYINVEVTYTMLRHAQAPRNLLRERVLRENWRVRDRDGYSHLPYINVEVTYTMLRHAQAPRNVLRERVLRENWRDRDGYSHLPYINVEVTYTMLRHAQAPRNVLRERVLRENWRVRDRDGYSHLPYINVEVREHRLFTLIGVKL